MKAYEGSIVIHDVARKNSIVHTDYQDIANAPFDNMIYTHNPDNLTAWRPILCPGKRLVIRDGMAHESVRGRLYPFDADVYVHHFSGDHVGYQSEKGAYKVIERGGLLGIVDVDHREKGLMRVDLYQDIRGEYFPVLTDPNKYYRTRPDGRIEEVTICGNRTSGRVVENIRDMVCRDWLIGESNLLINLTHSTVNYSKGLGIS